MLRVFSTFTGIGGFEIGIHRAAIRKLGEGIKHIDLVGYSEIDKYATQVFDHHFKGVRNYGDITKIDADSLPDFDCLVGGFPCQAFSIAGRRGGFSDTRGTLFFDLARILRAKQPRLFVFENVKGLLNHDGGATFRTIIATIGELGYDCQWQLLNSKNHGVPQNRERIIIVGHLRGTPRPQVFPLSGADSKDLITLNQARHDYDRVYASEGIAPALNTGQRGNAQPKVISLDYKHPRSTTRRGRVKEGVVGSLDTDVQVGIVAKTVRAGGRNSPHGSKQNWDSYLVDGAIRRLTPLECERLQGFPDNWTKVEGISDTQRYKMCGNAVTTNVIQAVFERLI